MSENSPAICSTNDRHHFFTGQTDQVDCPDTSGDIFVQELKVQGINVKDVLKSTIKSHSCANSYIMGITFLNLQPFSKVV